MAVRVRMNDGALAAPYARGGEMYRVAERDSLAIMTTADRKAPTGRSGRGDTIKGQHRRRVVPASAAMRVQFFVENTSGHAAYVHEGTTGPIFPLRTQLRVDRRGRQYSPKLRLVLAPGVYRFATQVRGQKAQPWLRKAATEVLRRRYGFSGELTTFS